LAPKVHAAAGALADAFKESPEWQAPIRDTIASSHLDPVSDLPTARKQFHKFSTALVELAKSVRGLPEFMTVKVYECPMARRSFPGAPHRASWFQLQGPIRNPYFGAEMLDCGTEVRP
jgi:hypothetical protein